MNVLHLFVRGFLAISLMSFASVNAAVFIKIGDIKGESIAKDHVDEIEVLSWSWGVTRPLLDESGSTRTRGNPNVIDLGISKLLDRATPKLVEACVMGTVLPEAVLVIESPSLDGNIKVLEIILSNVTITADNLAGSVEAIETVSLDFEEIEMRYFLPSQDGSPGGTVDLKYNLSTATTP